MIIIQFLGLFFAIQSTGYELAIKSLVFSLAAARLCLSPIRSPIFVGKNICVPNHSAANGLVSWLQIDFFMSGAYGYSSFNGCFSTVVANQTVMRSSRDVNCPKEASAYSNSPNHSDNSD